MRGPRVAVTRPDATGGELAALLRAGGAEPIVLPLTRISPPADPAPLLAAAAGLDRYDWIIFTSANAVHALAEALTAPLLTGQQPAIAVVGPATAAAVRERFGWATSIVPDEFTGASLARALRERGELESLRVLWPRAEGADPAVANAVAAEGALLDAPIAYRSVQDSGAARKLRALIESAAVDVLTFTAPSAVHSYAAERPAGPQPPIAVIGPATAAAVRTHRLRVALQPAENTIPALADAVLTAWRESRLA